jgi:hypothetical protein
MNTSTNTTTGSQSLLATQWAAYQGAHQNRENLILHVVTVPFFMAGTVLVAASPLLGWGAALGGLVTMLAVMAVQGRGHSREASAPAKFKGAGDFAARIMAEQWITLPRFVLSGGLARALRRGEQAS